MFDPNRTPFQDTDARAVLDAFGFEFTPERLGIALADWEVEFGRDWLLLAIVESLHQGRYKLASVGQILRCWQRRGGPRLGFDREFQRFVLKEYPSPPSADYAAAEALPTRQAPVFTIPTAHSERKLRALAGLQAV